MKMFAQLWALPLAIGAVLVLPSLAQAQAPGQDAIYAQLMLWFDKSDANHDGFLDAGELAKAFRGPYAKAYEPGPDSTAKVPSDYKFLKQVDTDGDGKVSRDEYESWARNYSASQARAGAEVPTGYVPMFNTPWLMGQGGPAFPGGYAMGPTSSGNGNGNGSSGSPNNSSGSKNPSMGSSGGSGMGSGKSGPGNSGSGKSGSGKSGNGSTASGQSGKNGSSASSSGSSGNNSYGTLASLGIKSGSGSSSSTSSGSKSGKK